MGRGEKRRGEGGEGRDLKGRRVGEGRGRVAM